MSPSTAIRWRASSAASVSSAASTAAGLALYESSRIRLPRRPGSGLSRPGTRRHLGQARRDGVQLDPPRQPHGNGGQRRVDLMPAQEGMLILRLPAGVFTVKLVPSRETRMSVA